MKIERAKLKKSNSDLPEACRRLIDELSAAQDDVSIYNVLKNIDSWEYGKSELYHWVDVLDKFDDVMERSCAYVDGNIWKLACDQPENQQLKLLMLEVIKFTALLIEHSFQRHSYESMDHLITLLSSSDMTVVLEVLNVLYVFSKRSNFFTRLAVEKKKEVLVRLKYLAESWGGKENGFGLADCSQDLPIDHYPANATTVHFEFYTNRASKTQPSTLCAIHLEKLHNLSDSPAEIMNNIISEYEVPENKRMLLFTHIRLAHAFSNFKQRTNCILARLQAISILVYSHAVDNEEAHQFIYDGFITELVNVLELKTDALTEMKAAVLRTLTAIIHLERNPKLDAIIDETEAYTYHGFLPSLVRKCILNMVEADLTPFPQAFSTALFSFLYHLASYESGGDALLSCGVMPSLLHLVSWPSDDQDHITFVTRAVRIIDLMTNMCTQSFETHNGLKVFIDRLEHEVSICRKEQPYYIRVERSISLVSQESVPMDVGEAHEQASTSTEGHAEHAMATEPVPSDLSALVAHQPKTNIQCLPQRSALLKSILNFFKKVIPEPSLSFADSIRHVMEGPMPKALQHIISNAEYYGASLFLLALDVVTVYIFQEPSQLSALQNKGVTEVVLKSLLVKDVPATREVLAALPNVFSALCLNQAGLDAFVTYKPFDKLFKVLLSPEYLPAMRKRKSSDAFGDTANNLGTAMDELMRHQPSLRTEAMKSIIGLLKEIIRLGSEAEYTCSSKTTETTEAVSSNNLAALAAPQSSDIESEDEEDVSQSSNIQNTLSEAPQAASNAANTSDESSKAAGTKAIPLIDYILNVMKFIDAIMGNTSDDHCQEFISQGGLEPLFTILRLPNLPIDFPTSQACQTVSNVCTVLLKLTHESRVLEEGFKQLEQSLSTISKLYEPLDSPGGSVLLSELAKAVSDSVSITDAVGSATATPLLHALSSVQAYIKVFVHMCRFGQADLKQISLDQWGNDTGLSVLSELGKLYYSLVWEGTVLLALCSDSELVPPESGFAQADLNKVLQVKSSLPAKDMDTDSNCSNGVTAAMEDLTTTDNQQMAAPVATDEDSIDAAGSGEASTSGKKPSAVLNTRMKQLKPLINISSRLGSSLAELFHNVLVKLSVGSVMLRQRRSQHQPSQSPQVPSAKARAVAKALADIAVSGLKWNPPTDENVEKLHLSFMMCVVGFQLPILFEENKHSYHLMLQEFNNVNGFDTFFEVFFSKFNVFTAVLEPGQSQEQKLPDYLTEFLDAWLLLAEKLINPKCITESVYPLPAKSNSPDFVPFNSTQHLKKLQKPVFDAIMKLWEQGVITRVKSSDTVQTEQLEHIAASMLAILCHIIKSEKLIKEKDTKKGSGTSTPAATTNSGSVAAAATATAASSTVQSSNSGSLLSESVPDNGVLRDLMDMGFPRERCLEALNVTTSLESATEYILTHMTAGTAAGGSQFDLEMSEDEQIRAAIQLSLTGGVEETAEQPGSSVKPVLESSAKPLPSTSKPVITTDGISTDDLVHLKSTLVTGCLSMLDALPSTVFKICQLLVVLGNEDQDWRKDMFNKLLTQISDLCIEITRDVSEITIDDQSDAINYFTKDQNNLKLSSRMHLLTLVIQELESPLVSVLQENNVINSVLQLIDTCVPVLEHGRTAATPQWMATVLLIIDQCEKAAVSNRRKAESKRVLKNSSTWKWFDDRNGKWNSYTQAPNTTIDNAYKNGESSVRFTAGRRKYQIQFNTMIQLNEDTGNRRPVMLALPSSDSSSKDQPGDSEMEVDSTIAMMELTDDQIMALVRCCVKLISIPVERDTLHAVLRVCLRFTRSREIAELFVSSGGIDSLLALTQQSAFTGFTSLCTLLIRHVLEEENVLQLSFEQAVREAAAGIGSNFCGVSSSSMGCKEINYVMRQLGPAMCRNPVMLKAVSKRLLKITLQNGKEPQWSLQHQVDLVSTEQDKDSNTSGTNIPSIEPSEMFKKIIHSLLNVLILPYTRDETDKKETSADTQQSAATGTSLSAQATSHESAAKKSASETSEGDGDKQSTKPLLTKSSVLRILSECVKAYTPCANIIVQHVYSAGQSETLNESCSALAFLFDRLLPMNQEDGDKDCTPLSRVLLASIASCNHSPDAQNTLITELKSALQRTLALPEVTHKYTHIQNLASLVSTLIDACSGSNQSKHPLLIKPIGGQSMNQLVKLMIKRGLVSDLARVPHSLDLSNPSTVATVNSLLRPLETLSRIVNQPQLSHSSGRQGGNSSNQPAATSNSSTNTAANNANNVPRADNSTANANYQQLAEEAQTTCQGQSDNSNNRSSNEGSRPTLSQQSSQQDEVLEDIEDMDVMDEDSLFHFPSNELNESDLENNTDRRILAVDVNISLPEGDEGEDVSQDEDDDEDGEEMDEENLVEVTAQVEALEQALDEILSQGRSEHSVHDDDDPTDEDNNEEGREAHADEETPFHQDEEDDTTDDDDDEDDEEDDDEDEAAGQGQDGGELGLDDDDDIWSDDEDIADHRLLANLLDDDNEIFSRLEAYDPLGLDTGVTVGRPRILVAEHGFADGFRALPTSNHDNDAGDDLVQSLPPAPNPVPMSHPLMNPTTDIDSGRPSRRFMPNFNRLRRTAANRPDRNNIERLSIVPPTQTSFIQRLFGHGMAANILQLTTRLGATRLFISDEDAFRSQPRNEEDPFADYMQDGMDRMKNNCGPGILSAIPSNMYRWIEECRVLDGPSVHDVVTVVKSDVIDHLQKDKKERIEAAKAKSKDSKATDDQTEANKAQVTTAATTTSALSRGATVVADTQRNILRTQMEDSDEDGDNERLRSRSRQLLSSMEALFGAAEDLAHDVALLRNRQQELRSLISVSRAQISSSASVTTSAPVSTTSSTMSTLAGLRTTAAATDSTRSLSAPLSSTEVGANAQPTEAALPPPEAAPTDLSAASISAPETSVEQDRACTPPSIFYDGDQPVPQPHTEPLSASVTDPTITTDQPASEASNVENSEQQAGNTISLAPVTANLQTTETAASEAPVTPAAASATEAVGAAGGSSTDSSVLGLEGVDPSFLEALPESIRREVIEDQLRLARIQSQARQQTDSRTSAATNTSSSAPITTSSAVAASTSTAAAGTSSQLADVSPEFLAALPPSIQEEVLAVQRAEQARQVAATSAPDSNVDPGGFLNSLPHSLRQQILSDMDDSQISVLPADLMAEAQLLRGEYEDRTRRLQDQLFNGGGSGSTLGNILRQSGFGSAASRLSTSRFLRRGFPGSGSSSGMGSNWPTSGRALKTGSFIRRGRQLLDTEALTCLLVLLFLDEPRLNTNRLHRIFKNLGHHSDTLLWIIQALISILTRTTQSQSAKSTEQTTSSSGKGLLSQSAWLSFGTEAALGCRANVFQVQHYAGSKKGTASSSSGQQSAANVTIHPQAAQLVCQHVLDTLIYLSKAFPQQFLPDVSGTKESGSGSTDDKSSKDAGSTPVVKPKSPKQSTPISSTTSTQPSSFWDVLVRLDQMRLTKKGKSVQKSSSSVPLGTDVSLNNCSIEESPLGQLLTLLSTSGIKKSSTLTDRLLKLLSVISMSINDKNATSYGRTDTSSAGSSGVVVGRRDGVLLQSQLQTAVDVLTSKSCSEEGLEDCTKFLVRLSTANESTKQYIVSLLLTAARQIALTVNSHIGNLQQEVKQYNEKNQQSTSTGAAAGSSGMTSDDSASDLQALDTNLLPSRPGTSAMTTSQQQRERGLLIDRFRPGALITINAPKSKRPLELQLPSMSLLTAKSSSQQFLLRLLKVIIQLSTSKTGDSTGAASSTSSGVGGSSGNASTPGTSSTTSARVSGSTGQPMEVDTSPATDASKREGESCNSSSNKPTLSERLQLDYLWETLGSCLTQLSNSSDHNSVLVLQPAVEAFFLVHAGQRNTQTPRQTGRQNRRENFLSSTSIDENPASPGSLTISTQSVGDKAPAEDLPPDTKKFIDFAETHRTVLNQILRQSQSVLSDEGPFSVLVDHTKLLDFDVKLRYFRAELQKLDEGSRREDVAVHVRRDHVFEDSYRELFRRNADEWKNRFYIVFEGEEGQDAGGLLREWYVIMSREIFNPNYALFMTTPQDRVTYTINPLSYCNSEHLSYFKFVGRIIGKAIYDNKLLECYFTRSFYKHITGQPVRYTDMEAEDYTFYQGLEFLLTHNINDLGYDLTFSTEIQEFGVATVRELKEGGANILVTEDNKKEYVKLVCQLKMTGAIKKQLEAFLDGFYDIIPRRLISIFNEQELELLISGLPTIDIDDLKANSEYHKYTSNSLQIIWFWRALRSFDQAERARFLQFVTGTSKVPLQGFAFLEGMNGIQKFQIHRDDRSTDRLPCAHTCFNQLDLPAYETFDKLRKMLLLVINECSEGFGLA